MIPDRSHIDTERSNPRSTELHTLDARGLVRLMNTENQAVQTAMSAAEESLAVFIAAAAPGFLAGGRLVYLGAGTSGRLGVLDASEIPPTFCAEPGKIIGIIAGGDRSLRIPSEGAEDDPSGALSELAQLNLNANDTVLGIAAGGTTPYVRWALEWLSGGMPNAGMLECWNKAGAITAADGRRHPLLGLLTCADVPVTSQVHRILLPTGPEVLTGSTRLKAGTATKLALNTISTALMVLSGKVHGNLMVDVKATNVKLRDRAARIVTQLTTLPRDAAFALLEQGGWSAKTAVVMHRKNCNRAVAEAWLLERGGRL